MQALREAGWRGRNKNYIFSWNSFLKKQKAGRHCRSAAKIMNRACLSRKAFATFAARKKTQRIMIKILANDGMEADAVKALTEAGFQVQTEKINPEALPSRINDFEVLTVRSATKVRKELIDQMTRTRLIIRGGVGLDNIDVEYAQSKGITVRNTPLASSLSVAELVFAHLFGLARFLHDSNRQMPVNGSSQFNELKKKYTNGFELRGKTLGLIGFGNIGAETARIAIGLGMKVMAFDVFPSTRNLRLQLPDDQTLVLPLTTTDKERVLENADFISIHAAGSQEVLSREDFERMKTGVVIINCARGGVIKEEVLLEFLNKGKVSFAGLDVYEEEPTRNTALLQHPRVSLTPHIGASTLEAQKRIGEEVVSIIKGFEFKM